MHIWLWFPVSAELDTFCHILFVLCWLYQVVRPNVSKHENGVIWILLTPSIFSYHTTAPIFFHTFKFTPLCVTRNTPILSNQKLKILRNS